MESHHMPVGALAWSFSLLSCGSRDKRILHHDIHAQEDYVSKLTGHKSEVCNLVWSKNVNELVITHRLSKPNNCLEISNNV